MKKLLVFLLVLGLAAPAMASDWYFYGSGRTHLGYYDVDEDFGGGPAMDGTIRAPGYDDGDSGLMLALGGQSRFGAKAVLSDNFSGNVEFGLRESGGDEVYTRLLFGTWNFGTGKLIVGQNYTPGTFLGYSSMIGDLGDNGDAVMLVSGLAYIGRQPLVELQFGSFEFALIQQNTGASDGSAELAAAAETAGANPVDVDKDFVLPRIEMAYVFRTPIVSIRPILGFQTYNVEGYDTVTGDSDDEDITSWLAGIGASFKLGPAYIKATFSYHVNSGNYGQSNVLVVAPRLRDAGFDSSGDIEDSTMMQGTFVVGANLNQMFGLEAGVGYAKAERDDYAVIANIDADPALEVAGFADAEQQGMVYYLQAQIRPVKGLTIIPEIGMLDRDDFELGAFGDTKLGTMTYFDINFRVDF